MSEWPNVPTTDPEHNLELIKILYQGQITEAGAQVRDRAQHDWELEKDNWARDKAALEAEYALNKSVHDARLEIAKGALDRGKNGAEFVRNAAAAVTTLYTGILGLSFSATKSTLPARGAVPAILFGLALVFATSYMAWLGRAPNTAAPKPHSSLPVHQERRLNAFSIWASTIALDRAYALHASVLALGLGVLSLPLPFLKVKDLYAWILLALALLIILLGARTTARIESR